MCEVGDSNGPLSQFADELDELIHRWQDKPEDDRLTYAEIVGALESVKTKLIFQCWAQAGRLNEMLNVDPEEEEPNDLNQ